jgi:site-specific recombinase XerD
LTDSLLHYLKENKLRRLSSETIAKDEIVIKIFITWLNQIQVTELRDVTKDHARSYLIQLKDDDLKSISINGYRSNLERFFKWCVKRGHTKDNPFSQVSYMKEDKPLPSYVPMHEMESLFEKLACSSTLTVTQITMFEFFYATGIRTTELINLDLVDVDLKTCLVDVREGKGGLQRFVPFPESLIPVIKRYLQIREQHHFTSPYLFPNAHGQRLHRSAAYRYIKDILDSTTSSKKGAHTIRHSYASHLLARGANLKAIAELLGHRSYKTTVLYTHLDTESKREIFEAAHPKA